LICVIKSNLLGGQSARLRLARTSIRSTSGTGLATIAPRRTAVPITPQMTVRHDLAVVPLTFLRMPAPCRPSAS
jgi:hypothetical protein